MKSKKLVAQSRPRAAKSTPKPGLSHAAMQQVWTEATEAEKLLESCKHFRNQTLRMFGDALSSESPGADLLMMIEHLDAIDQTLTRARVAVRIVNTRIINEVVK